jgi:alpha-L-arabinofuranosidase
LTITIEAPQQEIAMKDIETAIYTERDVRISIDEWDGGEVWFSLRNDTSSMFTTLTRKEVEQVIKNLQAVLAKEVEA